MEQLEYDLVRPTSRPLGWVVNVVGALWHEYKLSRYEYDRLFNSVVAWKLQTEEWQED